MYLIGKDQIERIWDLLERGLSRAAFEEDVGCVWTVGDIKEAILRGQSYGFYSPTSGYAGVMDILTYPSKKVLYVYWGGQDPQLQGHIPVDYEEMDSFLVSVAKAFGCSAIQVEGRRGWERKVKHLGYSLETINLYKEVINESS